MLTLVLLPGMDGTGTLFGPFVAALGHRFRVQVIAYPTREALGYAALEAHVRKALPVSGNFVILGESFSGPIAISIAASPPPGLIGVVLCATFARNPLPWLALFRPLVGVLPVKLAPTAVLSHLLMGEAARNDLRAQLETALAQVSASALRTRAAAALSVDVRAQLKSIPVPALQLLAAHDRVVPARASREVFEVLPAVQVVRIDAPHFLLQIAPVEAAQAVGAFMEKLPATH